MSPVRHIRTDETSASKGLSETCPNAAITVDKFHLIKLMKDALANVRAEEARLFPELLKGTR